MLAVLRLGHRIARDKRITTHVALTARAFGSEKMFLTTRDTNLVKRVKGVVDRFGGNFTIEDGVNWKTIIQTWKGTVVHLTMYGLPINKVIEKIPKDDVLVVVGGEKVPKEVFSLADFNVAIGNQPHSEVSALAVFLDRLLQGRGLSHVHEAKFKVIPSESGKNVMVSNDSIFSNR